ncbi:aldose 1-epimerase [Paenibacillus sp. NFR01]|uniref:aldose 1-epimerase n=1 Tax=Paenibacillus sp. NFR01 TaxID=1566279 RepID=UPI0008D79658|nr:aldose 1-epimerase [Paenibacillus sp. NFR01]SEU20029.1 aldose 1-epimerase [Paenibacillus sp. NFR01]
MKQVTKGSWSGYDTYILHSRDLEITLLPRLGNNVISMWDRKENRHILRSPEESELPFYMQKPYHFGMPLLVPPGRIRGGRFQYDGISYAFDPNSAGHHIHGLNRTQAWCVSDIEEDDDGCAVTTEFHTAGDADWMRQYPVPLKFEMVFRLQDAHFSQTLRVTHEGERTVPFGIGYHTWFRLDGEPQRWSLTLPAEAVYELNDELLPSGRLLPLENLSALPQGLNLQGTNLDTVLRVAPQEAASAATLLRDDGYGLRYTADQPHFKHWVVYTKGEADQYVCTEPLTWLPNAPNVTADEDVTGLIPLQPGQTITLSCSLQILRP